MQLEQASALTVDLLEGITDMGLGESFIVVPNVGLSETDTRAYWSLIEQAGLLDLRFHDGGIEDFDQFIDNVMVKPYCYYVVHCGTKVIVAEFSLDNFTGKAAQIHFSVNPSNSSILNVELADTVTAQLLYQWKDFRDLEQNFVETLYGLTPVPNRAACLFVLRAGFEKLGILPNSVNYMGEIADAMVTMKVRH